MQLRFDDIGRTTIFRKIENCGRFVAEGTGDPSTVQAHISLAKKDGTTVVIEGRIEGHQAARCDRCGEQTSVAISADFTYLATTRGEPEYSQEEKECVDEEAQTLHLAEPVIPLGEILREQLLLAMPQKALCDEGCKGICAGCGVMLNNESCRCTPGGSESPFAVLQQLAAAKRKK